MRKFIIVFILGFVFNLHLQAQHPRAQKEERIRAVKVAFITDALQMTSEEAQQFWPIYNEFEAKKKELRKSSRLEKRATDLTEQEAEQLIASHFENQEKQLQLERNYFERFKQVLSARQLVKLHLAERNFKRKLVERVRERR